MTAPRLSDLPTPPDGRTGWPWTEETAPQPAAADAPLVSVIVPSWNQGAFIEETLRSVLLQATERLEVIVCDDGSDDGTGEVLRRYRPWIAELPADSRGGMSAAVNRGLAHASGELVTWISTDDVYLPGAFHALVHAWRDTPAVGALVGGFELIDTDGGRLGAPRPARLDAEGPVDLSCAPPESWRLHQVGTIYTAPGLESAGRYVREDLDYVMDRELLFRVARTAGVTPIAATVARFRLHPRSKSHSSQQILAFAREFAALQNDFMTGERHDDRARRRIRRHRLAKGYLRYGARGERFAHRVLCLARALLLQPRRIATRDYWVRWLAALGLESAVRRLAGKDPAATLARGI